MVDVQFAVLVWVWYGKVPENLELELILTYFGL